MACMPYQRPYHRGKYCTSNLAPEEMASGGLEGREHLGADPAGLTDALPGAGWGQEAPGREPAH